MEQSYIIARLKDMTKPERLDVIAEAHAGEVIDLYEHLEPGLVDKTTDTTWEFIESLQSIKKE